MTRWRRIGGASERRAHGGRRLRLLVSLILSLGLLSSLTNRSVVAARQGDLATYVSPTWGYSLTYDPAVWEVVATSSDGGIDRLELLNGPSFVTLAGMAGYGGDPVACRDDWAARFGDAEDLTDFAPLLDTSGNPIAGETQGVAYAAFTLTSADGLEVIDLRCATLVPGVANLLIALETFADQYAEQVELLADLLAGLDLSTVAAPDPETLTGTVTPGGDQIRQPADEGVDQILIVDRFADPARSRLSADSPSPDQVRYAFEDGEYVIQTLTPNAGIWQAGIEGIYADVALAVDVRLVGESAGRAVLLGCRYRVGETGNSEYSLLADPAASTVSLIRWDNGVATALTTELAAPSFLPPTEPNRVELVCVGETIQAWVNGVLVAAVEDDRHESGYLYLAAGTRAGEGTCEARFDNLFITVYGE